MMGKRMLLALFSVLIFASILVGSGISTAEDAPRIGKEVLKKKMDENAEMSVIDVRIGSQWQASKHKIKGAVRADPKDLKALADRYSKDETLVFYCA